MIREAEKEREYERKRGSKKSLPESESLTAEMETMAQRRGSMDDSIHLHSCLHIWNLSPVK